MRRLILLAGLCAALPAFADNTFIVNAEGDGGKPQGPAQRGFLQHPGAGFDLAHRAVPIHHFCNTRGPA
jgi:hypothetical protein